MATFLVPAVGSRVQETSTGRMGNVVMKDSSDLPYKVAFDDDSGPACDWFREADLHVCDSMTANFVLRSQMLWTWVWQGKSSTESAFQDLSRVPLMQDSASRNMSEAARQYLYGICTTPDGVLYGVDRSADHMPRRRRVAPDSTFGWTPHLVVSSKSMAGNIPESVYDKFELVTGGKVTEGFRLGQEGPNTMVSESASAIRRDQLAHEMDPYVQVITLNSWLWSIFVAVVKASSIVVSRYATVTFISTLPYKRAHYDNTINYCLALLLPTIFLLNISWALYCAYKSATNLWNKYIGIGDIVTEDFKGYESPGFSWPPPHSSPNQVSKGNCVVSKWQRSLTFFCLFAAEMLMISRTVREAPLNFHSWKGSGGYAAIKAEGARIHFISQITFSAFQVGEKGAIHARMVVGIICELLIAVLKLNVSKDQGIFFVIMTIGVPLLLAMQQAYSYYNLVRATRHLRTTLFDIIERATDGTDKNLDPSEVRTAVDLINLYFKREANSTWKSKLDSIKGTKMHRRQMMADSKTFAARLHSRGLQFKEDLTLFEAQVEVAHFANLLSPLLDMLKLCALDAPVRQWQQEFDEMVAEVRHEMAYELQVEHTSRLRTSSSDVTSADFVLTADFKKYCSKFGHAAEIERIVHSDDANKDGIITREEFVTASSRITPLTPKQILSLFDRALESQGSGMVIDSKAMVAFLYDYQELLRPVVHLDALTKDINAKHHIDCEAFQELLQQHAVEDLAASHTFAARRAPRKRFSLPELQLDPMSRRLSAP